MAIFNVLTEFGSTFVEGNQQAYVRRGENYIVVGCNYLNAGDKVLFLKEHVTKNLDQIDARLENRVEDYRNAKSVLLEKNADGIYIPRLRTEIIRGIVDYTGDLDEKLLRNQGSDFTASDYRAMTDLTHEIIIQYSRNHELEPPVWETVLHWIKGDVIAPANKKFFDALGAVNPSLKEIYTSFEQQSGFGKAYHYFTGRRRGLMSYIAKMVGGNYPNDDIGRLSSGFTGGNLIEEINIILEEFGSDIKSHFIDAQIMSIDTVRKKNEERLRKRKTGEPHLFRGLYTGNEAPENRLAIRLSEINLASLLGNINPLKEPDLYVSRLKEICAEYGFPTRMMKDNFLKGTAEKGIVEGEVRILSKRFIGEFDTLKLEYIRILQETTGIEYSSLQGAQKAYYDDIFHREYLKGIEDVIAMIGATQKNLKVLKDKIREIL